MKYFITLLLAVILMVVSAAAFASEHEGGRQIWKKNCRVACHEGKTPGSPLLSPDSKTQYQWKNSFADDKSYILMFHEKGSLDFLKEKDWDGIYDFVYHHAHDSNNPEDCMGNAGELVR